MQSRISLDLVDSLVAAVLLFVALWVAGLIWSDYTGLVSIGLFDVPLFGGSAVAWMALAIAITWPRFPRKTVPEFLDGLQDLLRGRR